MLEAMQNFLTDRGGDTGGGGFFKGVQNWANGVNKRMSGQAPPMSGLFPGMTPSPQVQQQAQQNMAQPNPNLIDSFKRIQDLFSSPMHTSVPMSTSYNQMPVPNYGAGAPSPYGVRQSMATPYSPTNAGRGMMWS